MQNEIQDHENTKNLISLFESDSFVLRKSLLSDKISLALVDQKPLTLASFCNFINDNSNEYEVFPFQHYSELVSYTECSEVNIKIIIFNIGSKSRDSEYVNITIPHIKTLFPKIPLVVIADCEESDCIMQTIKAGAQGYITTSLIPAVVVTAIKMVLEGGIYAPIELLLSDINKFQQAPEENKDECPSNQDVIYFTPRQLEVLDLLKQGKPNKVIAYQLGMQECTVKVHVRDIMKKLNATNRTQLVYNANLIQTADDTLKKDPNLYLNMG